MLSVIVINLFVINMFVINMFINRSVELKKLLDVLSREESQLILVYGRRRTGKTSLIIKALEQFENSVYLYTPIASSIDQVLASYGFSFKDAGINPPNSWREFLDLLYELGDNGWIVAIDEFQRLDEAFKPAISLLQDAWDRFLSKTGLKLILCGSAVGVIERLALSGSAPLLGRVDCILKVRQMNYLDARAFYPGDEENKFKVYSYFGGTPAYASRYDKSLDLWGNLERLVLNRGAPLLEEPERVLMEETRAKWTYSEILAQLASVKGLPLSKIKARRGSPVEYLRVLERMDLIKRVIPPTEVNPARPKRCLYVVADRFFKFWFKYVYPNLWMIESGRPIISKIKAEEEKFLSEAVEEIIIDVMPVVLKKLNFPLIDKAGPWWYKEFEIDFVGLSRHDVVISEIEWGLGTDELVRSVCNKAELFMEIERWRGPVSKIVIARDFTEAAHREAERSGVTLLKVNYIGRLIG